MCYWIKTQIEPSHTHPNPCNTSKNDYVNFISRDLFLVWTKVQTEQKTFNGKMPTFAIHLWT